MIDLRPAASGEYTIGTYPAAPDNPAAKGGVEASPNTVRLGAGASAAR
jgi:hypothetical protein